MKVILHYIKPFIPRMSVGISIKFIGAVMELLLPWILSYLIDDIVPLRDIGLILLWGGAMVLAAVGWSMANDMLALNKTSTSATITVEDENDFGSVVDQLKTNNIIEHTVLFRLFAAVTGGDDEIAQGTYVVDSDMDYRALSLIHI